jgi:putative transposase
VVTAYIDGHRERDVEGRRLGVEPICEVLQSAGVQIAPSTYYAAKTRPASARAVRDGELVPVIRQAHKDNLGVYGARKVWAELNRNGHRVARCTIERLMRADGLAGITREKTRKTTIGEGAETERPADLVERQFTAAAPNRLWVADLTSVRTHSGWVYAAFALDVFSRMAVGWQVSTSLRTDLALDALDMGLWSLRRAGPDVTGLTSSRQSKPAPSGDGVFGRGYAGDAASTDPRCRRAATGCRPVHRPGIDRARPREADREGPTPAVSAAAAVARPAPPAAARGVGSR